MFPLLPRTTVSALSVLLCLSSIYVAYGQSCGCSSIVIPVHIDVLISKDPADPFGGLKNNASSLRRLDDTYNVFGAFCQPNTAAPKHADVIQLLVHGFTYTNQYWSPPTEEFRNYSYSEFACDRGLSSLAIDWVGVGLSSRPVNPFDVQAQRGINHAILESAQYPFDGLILTSSLNVDLSTLAPLLGATSAQDDTPLRWDALDPNYITTSNRSIFYPTNPTAFSPHMVIFDNFTKDVESVSTVVGSDDRFFGAGGRCIDVAALTAAEHMLWPEAQSFEVVVAQGSGHDMNLDFFAKGPFSTFVGLVNQFTVL
ncbi:hypothetical protein B0H19DRAFT_1083775 [Mycena capillaripes]|nr:hypothetical protein B0H19DRAFT_1083775 [Mycena capillaripes]